MDKTKSERKTISVSVPIEVAGILNSLAFYGKSKSEIVSRLIVLANNIETRAISGQPVSSQEQSFYDWLSRDYWN